MASFSSSRRKAFQVSRSMSLNEYRIDQTPGSPTKGALHDLVLRNSVQSLQTYLKSHQLSWLNSRDDYGNTPLLTAAQYSRVESVKMLLKAGADPNMTTQGGFTALHEAAEKGCQTIVTLLVQNDDCFLDSQDRNGNTALMRAAYYNYTDIVSILYSAGANLDLQNSSGQTALMISLWEGSDKTAEFLVNKNCDLKISDQSGHTAFYVAVHCELLTDLTMAKLIINTGYDVRHDAWWLARAPFRSKLISKDKFCREILEKIK